ncbi:aldo/keto reductase [Amycolatopsis sp. K13G38]|uniref:Aldo/keto reductase n=2 Tax=Amycolatopsis acididurans TaxID=2724524 RepID=A0ABX1J8K1_9PSEU|nr:aldo/keto reductase [Amycolatopsis acididurans]
MPTRQLGELVVGAIGLGCTAMSAWYGEVDQQEAVRVLRRAHEYGVTLIDTADNYGPFTSEQAIGTIIDEIRDRVVLSTKGGLYFTDRTNFKMSRDGSPGYLRRALDASLRRLRTDYVDLYYLHRVDPAVPIEESIGFLAEQVTAGKIRAIGLSDVDVPTLDRAHAVHPISAVESELSLWTREPLPALVGWCRSHGAGFVPYAPLGRGFLAGNVTPRAKFASGDFRAGNPRFTPEAIEQNMVYVERIRAIADHHGVAPAVIALAWLLSQAENVIPIPGMEKMAYLTENIKAAALNLTAEELRDLDTLPPAFGSRLQADLASVSIVESGNPP